MTQHDMPSLARVAFFDGQRLTATDLSDMQARDRELRWLHNRSLHAWGIALGLGVTGATGDREVAVAPGYGTDCLGREIILAERRVVAVPPVAGMSDPDGPGDSYYLVARYAEDADLDVDEQRAGVCAAGGAVRRREAPLLDWQASVPLSTDLVLAQVWVRNCKLSRPVSLEVRRLARPSDQPYLASGTTAPGGDWQAWSPDGTAQGVRLTVDTSAARFGSAPRYVAHVVGPRVLGPDATFVEGVGRVTEATAGSFVYSLVFLDPSMADQLAAIKAGWQVTWLGVET